MKTWQPSATIETLQNRAKIIQKIRTFFAKRNVLEVETPTLSQATVTDIHLHTFQTQFKGPGFTHGLPLYMMTSPEFHMKRLLAAGSGAIYQICKSFRNEEAGRFHNPEFTMLEWYRPDFDHHDLMNEMEKLLLEILSCRQPIKMSYQEAFLRYLNICPLEASLDELKSKAKTIGLEDITKNESDRDIILQLLFNLGIESQIGQNEPCFIYHFPASQAALARICQDDPRVAARFEVYFHGVELANGFYELDCAQEQLSRFENDNQKRLTMNLSAQPIDMHLIQAIEHGLPACSGVALGIDRLIMLALEKKDIADVIAFPINRA